MFKVLEKIREMLEEVSQRNGTKMQPRASDSVGTETLSLCEGF